ncbi:MAG TPA: PqqD family protein, partial [Thermoanaerobaculia bacterium]|nr:PqqD family protein [Thermoanaerobaculia bacterium]
DRAVIRDGVMFNRVGDEIVILDLDSGTYFGLDAVGSRLWDLIAGNHTIAEAMERMLEEYEVTAEELDRDVFQLLRELEEKKLLAAQRGE